MVLGYEFLRKDSIRYRHHLLSACPCHFLPHKKHTGYSHQHQHQRQGEVNTAARPIPISLIHCYDYTAHYSSRDSNPVQ